MLSYTIHEKQTEVATKSSMPQPKFMLFCTDRIIPYPVWLWFFSCRCLCRAGANVNAAPAPSPAPELIAELNSDAAGAVVAAPGGESSYNSCVWSIFILSNIFGKLKSQAFSRASPRLESVPVCLWRCYSVEAACFFLPNGQERIRCHLIYTHEVTFEGILFMGNRST